MAAPAQIPNHLLDHSSQFADAVLQQPDALIYFLCNVGDGDSQLVLLPQDPATGSRQAVVVDSALVAKIPRLLRALREAQILNLENGGEAEPIALVVASHPHDDHIGGIGALLNEYGTRIAEFWDPGYFHSIGAYHSMMARIEGLPHLFYAHPTSGFRRWIGDVAVTVLSPSVHLRNRFDSYGTEINDSSISLRLEFPARRYLLSSGETATDAHEEGEAIDKAESRALILGADAQTLSWSFVLTDFPFLHKSESPAAKAIAAATGDNDLLKADVLKVSHHGSKHGINLELVERIDPKVTLVSSVRTGGSYNFPHTVAQELIREALDPAAKDGHPHPKDYELGVFYTCDLDESGKGLGSIALIMTRNDCSLWRFGDRPSDPIVLTDARRWHESLW